MGPKLQWRLQQLHGDSGRQPVTMRNGERHVSTSCDQRESERQPVTIEDCKRNAAILWDQRDSERQPATMEDSERHASTPCNWKR